MVEGYKPWPYNNFLVVKLWTCMYLVLSEFLSLELQAEHMERQIMSRETKIIHNNS